MSMGDPPRPQPQLMSPPPSIPTPHLHILYYGLVVVGTTVVVLVLYNFIIVRWSVNNTYPQAQERDSSDLQGHTTSRRVRNLNMDVIRGFKYKKDGGKSQDECVVCLSVFEEGEELWQMPNCKHSFHAPCIDMWLYSHMDCPLCRSPAFFQLRVVSEEVPEEHSREGLLGTGALA